MSIPAASAIEVRQRGWAGRRTTAIRRVSVSVLYSVSCLVREVFGKAKVLPGGEGPGGHAEDGRLRCRAEGAPELFCLRVLDGRAALRLQCCGVVAVLYSVSCLVRELLGKGGYPSRRAPCDVQSQGDTLHAPARPARHRLSRKPASFTEWSSGSRLGGTALQARRVVFVTECYRGVEEL